MLRTIEIHRITIVYEKIKEFPILDIATWKWPNRSLYSLNINKNYLFPCLDIEN